MKRTFFRATQVVARKLTFWLESETHKGGFSKADDAEGEDEIRVGLPHKTVG